MGKMLGLSTDMSNKRVSESAASWLKKMNLEGDEPDGRQKRSRILREGQLVSPV